MNALAGLLNKPSGDEAIVACFWPVEDRRKDFSGGADSGNRD
jgi:hypothetical protein